MKRKIAITIIFVFLTSCSSSFKIFIEKDKFKPGQIRYSSSAIDIKNVGLLSGNFSFLILGYNKTPSNDFWNITVYYYGDDWIFLKKLSLLIDENVYNIFTQNPYREVLKNGPPNVKEEAIFILDPEIFQKLANSKSLTIRVTGEKYYVEKNYSPEEIANFKFFYDYVISQINRED